MRTHTSDPQGNFISLAGAYATAMKPITDTQVTLGTAQMRLGQPSGAAPLVYQYNVNQLGTMSSQTLPPNNAALVIKYTALGGKRNKGRFYIPWTLGISDVDERGTITSTKVTAVQTACNALMTALNTNHWEMLINHSDSSPGTVHPSAVPGATTVTSLVVSSLVASQRRRLDR